jgi:hypothetical protein
MWRRVGGRNANLNQQQMGKKYQMKSWAGKALETVNCCGFLKRRLIRAC